MRLFKIASSYLLAMTEVEGGEVAGSARRDIEKRSGKKVSTRKNYLPKSAKQLK